MNSPKLTQWGGLAAMLGGLAGMGAGITFNVAAWERAGDALLPAAYLLTAAGLAGFHALQKEYYGRIGRGGFYTATIGSLSAVAATTASFVGRVELDLLHAVGALLLIVGYILYGVATLRARMLPAWCGVAFIVVGPVTLFVLGNYSAIGFGAAWLTLGYALWLRRDVPAEQSARVS